MSDWVKFDKDDKRTWPPFNNFCYFLIDGDKVKAMLKIMNSVAWTESGDHFAAINEDHIYKIGRLHSWKYLDNSELCQACGNQKSQFETDSIEKDPYSTCAVCGEIIDIK